MSDGELCRSRHPITREQCARTGSHLSHTGHSGVSWPIQRTAKRDGRERVKRRRAQDAREWGWTEAQR